MSPFIDLDDVYSDLDETLEHLLENAEILEEIEEYPKQFGHEIEALKELQTSLLSHLMTLDEEIDPKLLLSERENQALLQKLTKFNAWDEKIYAQATYDFPTKRDQLKISKSRKSKTTR